MEANALLGLSSVGWIERTDTSAIVATHRVERVLGIGTVQSNDEAVRVLDEQLAHYSAPQTQITLGIEPHDASHTPYDGFNVGDTVDALGDTERVVSIGVGEDANGRAKFETLLRTQVFTREERIEQAIKKSVNGTLQGDAKVATPLDRISPAQALPSPVDRGVRFADWGGFARGSTQSMTNGGTTDIQLDDVTNDPAGQECIELFAAGDLKFLVQGIYLVVVEAVGPSIAANGDFLLHWGVVMGNAAIGGDANGDRRITSSAVTTRPTMQATRFFAVDAEAVVTFKITQTSGANRNFTFFGNCWRLGDNPSLYRAVGIGTF